MRDLVTFYQDRLTSLCESDKWSSALKSFLLDKPIDKALISSLISLDSSLDVIQQLRNLVSAALLLRFQPIPDVAEELKKNLKQTYTRGYWKTFQLPEALFALGCFLLDLPMPELKPFQLKKGGLLVEMGNHLASGGVPDTMINGELALIWLFLGWETDNKALVHAALKWVHLSLALLDHEQRPFHGMWLKDGDYDPLSFFSLHALLFQVSSHLLTSSKLLHVKDVFFSRLEEIDQIKPPPFLIFLAAAFESLSHEKKCMEVEPQFSLHDVDESLGYLSARHEKMSFACSFNGVNTGLGALHKDQVRIVSFGPHFTPLADSDRYGFHRVSSKSFEAFHDVEWDQQPGRFAVKGWARLIAPSELSKVKPGKQWLYFAASGEGSECFFESRLSKKDDKYPLYFAYFISAKKALTEEGQALLPGTLDRYQGKSQLVTFQTEDETLTIKPFFEGSMQVIPLAGSRHFWSADFLMAYSLEEAKHPYRWQIC